MDHRMRTVRIELGGVGARKPANVARELDCGHLHAQAYAEEGDLPLAGVADRFDLSFAAAIAKTAGDQNAVNLAEQLRGPPLFDLFPLPAFQLDLALVGDAAVSQRLKQALVGFLEAHVFSDHGDLDRQLWIRERLDYLLPLL